MANMKIFTATNAKNHFGEVLDLSKVAPIRIDKQGRESAYVISPAMFMLAKKAIEDVAWGETALDVAVDGFLSEDDSEAFLDQLG